MKAISFALDETQSKWLLTSIRKKEDLITILMNSMKLMLLNTPLTHKPETPPHTQITLLISKMSRIFFSLEGKIFTFNFPFQVTISESGLSFYNNLVGEVDHKIISEVLGALNHKQCLQQDCVLDFLGAIEENSQDVKFWSFFRDLLLFEDGYLRYDHDNTERSQPDTHPTNHIDIFYSSSNSFKLGLKNKIDFNILHEILNAEAKCYFIS